MMTRSPTSPYNAVGFATWGVVVLGSLMGFLDGCKVVPGTPYRQYSAQDILYMSPIVVQGQVIAVDYAVNQVTLDLNCVFKFDGSDITQSVVVMEAAMRTSCQATKSMVGNETYIVALKRAHGNKYEINEPPLLNQAAWRDEEIAFELIASICDIPVGMTKNSTLSFVQNCPELPDQVKCYIFLGNTASERQACHVAMYMFLWLLGATVKHYLC